MLIEQPTFLLKAIYPKGIFRKDPSEKSVCLTFDDGPIPEVTPWVLDILDRYGIKATFFMVGDNVRKHPDVYDMVVSRGHRIGNHTFNHVRSMQMRVPDYIDNVRKCDSYFTTKLFRPPHGIMRKWVYRYMMTEYDIVFYDLVTRDYSRRQSGAQVLNNVRRYVRNGSIIVFHDSLRSKDNLEFALPRAIEWLLSEGYQFKVL